MANYYCAVHKDEDQDALKGEPLDACTNPMVRHSSYDLESLRAFISTKALVIWVMERDDTAKFGWRFASLLTNTD